MDEADALSTRTPKASILLTVHDGMPFLAEAFDSILQQSERDLELIVVDDGSSDGSSELIRDHAARDERVRAVRESGLGVTGALIAASARARGRYVGVVDQDDRLAPTAIAETARVLDEHAEIGWVFTDCVRIDRSGNERGFDPRCAIPFSPLRMLVDFVSFHFRLVRRELIDQLGGYRREMDPCADYDLCLRLSELARAARLRRALYFYRVHPASVTQRSPAIVREAAQRAVEDALRRRGLGETIALDVDDAGRFRLVPVPVPVAPRE